MKKILLALIMALVLGLTACNGGGSFLTMGSVENNTAHEMSMSYNKFNGYKYKEITVADGQPLDVSVAITSESGKLSAYIAKDDDKTHAAYSGSEIPTSEFTVTLTEAGKYSIRVDAEDAKGSYSFTW